MIIIAGATAGFLQSDKLDKRVKFIENYISFINDINTKIRYSMQPIEYIIKDCGKCENLLSFVNSISAKLEKKIPFRKAWEDSIIVLKNENILKAKDLSLVKEFGTKLGSSDVKGQTAHCQLSINMAKEELKLAREEKEKKSKLYKMLGLSLGLCVALLMV